MARLRFAYVAVFAFAGLGACSSSSASDASADAGARDAAIGSDSGLDASSGDDSGSDSAVVDTPWSAVSFGITTKDLGSGSNIAIAYGGYTATDEDSQAWVTEMTKTKLASLGVSHLYAVRGPKDADYSSREVGNSTLAAKLDTQAASASSIIIVAHSSGGFVADELFTFASADVLSKIAYFNLDGGSWALTSDMVSHMRGVYVCDAHDPVAGNSENTSSDQNLHDNLAGSHLFTVDATGSGCNVGAGWCLHDTLIIKHPHNPASYDLALDYTDFTSGRTVVTSYVDQAITDGVL